MPFESQRNQNPPLVGNMYELDCCFIPSVHLCLTCSKMFLENIVSVNDGFPKFEEIDIDPNESVYFEVTVDSSLLPETLKQIETGLRLWDTCIPHYPKPRVAGVIDSGSKENFSSLTTSTMLQERMVYFSACYSNLCYSLVRDFFVIYQNSRAAFPI